MASFLSHLDLKNGLCSIFLIYIFCLNFSIFRTKIQFYSVWERVRELAVSLFVYLKLPATHYYYSALPFKQVFQTYSNLHFFSFLFSFFLFWKNLLFHLHLHFVTCLEVSAELVGTSLLLRNGKKKKKRYSTSIRLSTINKYSISLYRVPYYFFNCTISRSAVSRWWLT